MARVAIFDYGAGNIFSLKNALEREGATVDVISELEKSREYAGMLLPGVGHFDPAVKRVKEVGPRRSAESVRLIDSMIKNTKNNALFDSRNIPNPKSINKTSETDYAITELKKSDKMPLKITIDMPKDLVITMHKINYASAELAKLVQPPPSLTATLTEINNLFQPFRDYVESYKQLIDLFQPIDPELLDKLSIFVDMKDSDIGDFGKTMKVISDSIKLDDRIIKLAVDHKNNYQNLLKGIFLEHLGEIPVLGICLGMEIFFGKSEEGRQSGMNLIEGDVIALPDNVKIPHMGWNNLEIKKNSKILEGIPNNSWVYFVHSFMVKPTSDVIVAESNYGSAIPAIVEKNNLIGMQFHPEKSGPVGRLMLKNFLNWCKK